MELIRNHLWAKMARSLNREEEKEEEGKTTKAWAHNGLPEMARHEESLDSSGGAKRDKSDNKPLYSIFRGEGIVGTSIHEIEDIWWKRTNTFLLGYLSKDRFALSFIDRFERSLRLARERDLRDLMLLNRVCSWRNL